MKGVCAPGNIFRTRKPERGPQRCGPFLRIGRFALGHEARAPIDRLAVVVGKIVHGSLKSDENVCKTPDIG